MNRVTLSILLSVLLVVGCGPSEDQAPDSLDTGIPSVENQPVRPAEDALTQDQANLRKSRVSQVHYTLSFDLASSEQHFSGHANLHFDLSTTDSPLTVDLAGAEIDRIVVNGKVDTAQYNNFFITVPAEALLVGNNEIQVEYRHNYSRDGTGLHRFTDPEDGLTYLYTYLWPYYANRLFPAFDQPNLKATFDLQVRAPESWTVVSTGSGSVKESNDSVSTWKFDTTPKMSTYIFSLHAGPYKIWEEMAGDVPIRLFARQSLAEYVQVEEWFDITRGGLDFFARYFEISYPFSKYDQLIVPDFNIGAMENIAAVTFSEGYVQRQVSDRFEREIRAGTILHEMAHMWFGDLVTKDWWSELWLNESFATLMANIALVESTEFTDAWHRFFTENKKDAYYKDSRVTTHPIQVPINSTADFFSVFDAITYQKGSSVLKQLAHFVGYENHRIGVSNYLKEHSYGNTTLQDFIDAQSASSGLDLERWSQQWLYQAGFNELAAQFECSDGQLTQLNIVQTAPDAHPQLRQHRVQVALYQLIEDRLTLGDTFDVNVDGEQTSVSEAIGALCPVLVFPNHDDWAYAGVVLNEQDIDVIKGRIQHLQDPLARSMMIRALYEVSGTESLPIEDYVKLALKESHTESNIRVLAQLLQSISASVDLLYRLRPESDDALTEVLTTLAESSWNQVTGESDPDRARLWFKLLLETSDSSAAQDRLRSLLNESVTLPGVQLSEDLRWSVIIALSTLGASDSERLINDERERDPSDLGQKLAIAADAARPQASSKDHWLKEVINPDSDLGLARQRYAMGSLFPANQTGLQQQQLDRILQSLTLLSDRDPYFLSSYVTDLLQPICTSESVAAIATALESGNLNSTIDLFLREAHQADAECLDLRMSLTGASTNN
jgi:aminopeptidase N